MRRVVIIVGSAFLAACSAQTVNGHLSGPPAPTAPSTTDFPSASPTVTPPSPSPLPRPTTATPVPSPKPAAWVGVKDQRTGIRFQLPGRPQRAKTDTSAEDGTPLRTAEYEYLGAVGSGFGSVVVGVTSGRRGNRTIVNDTRLGNLIGPAVIARIKQRGTGRGARVIQKQRRRVHGHLAICYRITYRPANPLEAAPAWRVCEIDATPAILTVQVIDLPTRARAHAALTDTAAVQARLLRSLRFP